ncbi:MAG: TolC family protein [Bilophila wadsworthia]
MTFLPQVSLPIFEGGRNVANLRVSEADKKIAVANYEKAIQSAFREVSDALIDRVSLAGQLEAQKSLVHATSETYRLSGERYNQGIDSYLAVLDSQRAMYSSQLNLISVRVAREQNLIMLYKALGGGVKE